MAAARARRCLSNSVMCDMKLDARESKATCAKKATDVILVCLGRWGRLLRFWRLERMVRAFVAFAALGAFWNACQLPGLWLVLLVINLWFSIISFGFHMISYSVL